MSAQEQFNRSSSEIYKKISKHVPEIEWKVHAPLIEKINKLKKDKNAVILAHNYQTPEIYHGISDFSADSLALAIEAAKTKADIIVMCGVHFMAETAKLMSPNKKVLLPDMRLEEDLRKGIWEPRPPEGKEIYCARTPERISNPQNPYGMSKIAEEMFALQLGKRYKIPTVAMRYSIVQGSRQSFYNAYSGACRIFSLAFHQGKEPQIYEDGNQVRDFVNIHDVVDANLLVLEDERADYEMFNVGGGAPVTVNQFASACAKIYDVKNYQPKPSGKYRFGDTRHIWSDISKLESLGWKPSRTIYDSIVEYKEWLDCASSIDNIIEYCSKKMEELNVLRDVS